MLLIIFMVIQPATIQGLDALIPRPSRSPDRADQPQAIVVQLLGDRNQGVTYKINQTALNKREIESKAGGPYIASTS